MLVLLLEIERPLSKSHVSSKQSVFYFIKLSALFFSPLTLYFIFNPSLLFLPVFAGEISLCHVFLFFDCFLAAAWWAALHLLYYSYFDVSTPLACQKMVTSYCGNTATLKKGQGSEIYIFLQSKVYYPSHESDPHNVGKNLTSIRPPPIKK